MEEYIDKQLRVEITDGRIIEGQLKVVDNAMNMILSDSITVTDSQMIGTVMIPGEHVINCQLYLPDVS